MSDRSPFKVELANRRDLVLPKLVSVSELNDTTNLFGICAFYIFAQSG